MPGVAWKGGSSSVACTDGVRGSVCALCGGRNKYACRWHWDVPVTSSSNAGSGDDFANNIGVVRSGDIMSAHPHGVPCVPSPVNHTPGLSTFSPNVFANNKPIGRIGDKYNAGTPFDHTITSGSGDVIAN